MRLVWTALLGATAVTCASVNATTVKAHWLGNKADLNLGTTFGLPWPQGKYHPGDTEFTIAGGELPLETWVNGYWQDGSIKWTGHAIPATTDVPEELSITATPGKPGVRASQASGRATKLKVTRSRDFGITVDTGPLQASFATRGNVIVPQIKTSSGKTIGKNGKLVLSSQTGFGDDVEPAGRPGPTVQQLQFESNIESTTVSQLNAVRALVTVRGTHRPTGRGTHHDDWMPFILRFYLYADSEAIRIVHSIVYDGDATTDVLTGIGIRFQVPLADEDQWNRHIRFTSADGGVLHESPQGITGTRRDPGPGIRDSQITGQELPPLEEWSTRVSNVIQWVPVFGDYSLSQLSADGFTLKKRTEPGQSWINIPAGQRAGGLAYLGGATKGGLAISQRYFWKRYPTGIDIRGAGSDLGELTLWLYSPNAGPLDMRPFHDDLGLDSYEEQTAAIEATYEDYEPGFNTPYGVGRTNEIFLFGFDRTPDAATLASLSNYTDSPPLLVAEPEYLHETKALGSYWTSSRNESDQAAAMQLHSHLDFFVDFFRDQVEQRRWYGFWDHGDIMHNYDNWRHTWRYDVGGYAWDNSELSPDLFLWQYYLSTGREDVYRLAEAMTRHTSEVDVYHLGKWKGLGSRHNVQHWGDSAKQARISTTQYRKYLYYLSGGDERMGELVQETLNVEKALTIVDPQRKVRDDGFTPRPDAADIGLGIDYSALAASWLLEYERRGSRWKEARDKLNKTMTGIAALKNGFVTGSAIYNPQDGTLHPPPADPDNKGVIKVSHLSAVFGLVEGMSELLEYWVQDLPDGFEDAWLDYCYYYGTSGVEQKERYGASFGGVSLRQAHSRLTAYAAYRSGNDSLAARAWDEFFNFRDSEGIRDNVPWATQHVEVPAVLFPVDEATWMTTNTAMQYGIAAIQNLAWAGIPKK